MTFPMRIRATIVVLASAAGLLLYAPTPAALAASAPLPADGFVAVDGHGYGHGRGLGQWGAKGYADQGSTFTQILSTFYPGTALATRAPEAIRVLVEDSSDVLVTSTAPPFSVYWKGGAKVAESSAQYPFLRAAVSGSGLAVQRAASASGPWTTIATGTQPAEFHPGSQPLGLVLSSGAVKYYRGLIEARRPQGSASVLSINDLGIEAYLYGVVPREMPSSFKADALKSQAVAARSYAASKKDAARAAGKLYDICATTSCQVYGGYASGSSPSATPKMLEAAASNAAVDATVGRVLTYNGTVILAEYSSSTGGYTAPGSQGWARAVPDTGDVVSPDHNWTVRISVPTIQAAWSSIGSLTGVRITQRNSYGDWGGRVTQMTLDGTSGSTTISGDTFRSKLRLKSNWFRVRIYRGDLAASSNSVSGPTNSTIPVSVSLKNTGTAEWRVGGSEILATWDPAGRTSRFSGSEWRSASKPSAVTKNLSRASAQTIGPGEVAEFRFTLHTTNVSAGTYTERFRPLADGTTWMPDVGISITVHVSSSWVQTAGNALTNGSFESGWSGWSAYGGGHYPDGLATGTVRDGARSLVLTAGGNKGIVQHLSLVGGAGRRVTFGGWARTAGTSAQGGIIEFAIAFRNIDGSASWAAVEVGRATHDWQYVERSASAPKSFSAADLYLTFYNQTGAVYFDAVRLLDTQISNSSFELGEASWGGSNLGSGDGPSVNVFRDGTRSMHFAGGTKSLTQRTGIRGPALRRYHLSGWTKGDGASGTGQTSIAAIFQNTDGSSSPATLTATPGTHDWEYREMQAVAAKPFRSIDIVLSVSGQTGSIFFDAIGLRENRIENGSFEQALAPWTVVGGGSSDGLSSTMWRDAATSMRIAPASGRHGASVHLDSGGSAGASLLIGAWNRASASAQSIFMSVGFRNTDGSSTWRTMSFPAAAHDWVHQEARVRSDKAFTALDVYVLSDAPTGDVNFDGVTLWAPA